MKAAAGLAVATLLLSPHAMAYDSLACGRGLFDCEGLEAARAPWVHAEHADIWLATRRLGGLPAAIDDPFTVSTWTVGNDVGGSRSSSTGAG